MKEEYRISGGSAGLMYGVALVFDGISLIPIVGSIVPVFGSLTFWLWFRMKGVDFNSSRKFVTSLSATLVEVVPVVNVIPAWTLATFLIVQEVRAEDFLKIQAMKKKRADNAKRRVQGEETTYTKATPVIYSAPQITGVVAQNVVSESNNEEVGEIEENRLQNRVPLQDVKVPETVRKIGRIDYQVNPHFGSISSQQERIKTQKNAT